MSWVMPGLGLLVATAKPQVHMLCLLLSRQCALQYYLRRQGSGTSLEESVTAVGADLKLVTEEAHALAETRVMLYVHSRVIKAAYLTLQRLRLELCVPSYNYSTLCLINLSPDSPWLLVRSASISISGRERRSLDKIYNPTALLRC